MTAILIQSCGILLAPLLALCWLRPEILPMLMLRLYRVAVWCYAWSHAYVEWQELRRAQGPRNRARARQVAEMCMQDLRNPMTEGM